MNYIVTPLIPNDYSKIINKKDFRITEWMQHPVAYAISFLDYEKYDQKIIEDAVSKINRNLLRKNQEQYVMLIDEEEIQKEVDTIKRIVAEGGDPLLYDTTLLQLNLILITAATEGSIVTIHTNCVEYSNKDKQKYTVVYCATQKDMVKDIHISNLELFRREYVKKMLRGNKKRTIRTPIGPKLRHEVFKQNNYKCVECGASKEEKTLHVDHILPVSQGGTDELSNLRTLCEQCNFAKSNRAW